MDKSYNPHEIEQRWYQRWEQNNNFAPRGEGSPYCIMIPPPNVTGSLHMGHGFQNSLMDALVRYHRMRGDNTLWQVGTDHAGIATQMVVERECHKQNLTRHDLGREAFVDKIWEWKGQSGGRITQQLRRLGASVDWSRERFTMDDGLSKSVQEVFVQLYHEGLIYRGKRLVNWDPVFRTAVSDLEVVSTEEEGHLWHINYPLVNGEGHLTVATTRPETLLGDMAVAVHPEDERYRHLVGEMLKLPLTDRQIPVIVDEYVDPEFGSGCVKITPAHDFNDYEVGMRHNLECLNILTEDARINKKAPTRYQGLDRYAARELIVTDLKKNKLLEKIEDHKHAVPRGDRSGDVIEPYLTDQWYVKTKDLAAPAIKAVEDGDIKFIPENWSKTYFQWMYNIEDWCISRQLWWGHRIPAWYDDENNIYVGQDEQTVREQHNLKPDVNLRQDNDVLDTWFSSALWPFSTLGWPEQTEALKTFYPTQVLVTGFDIIFFWVARMIMFGLKFTGQVPFHEVYITGLIRDAEGHKMSKSKGNIIDPIDLIDGIDLESLVKKRTQHMLLNKQATKIEKSTRKEFPDGIPSFGTDALRFTFCALASTGRDIRFDLGRIEGYRNVCNKIWNAARYVLMNTEEQTLNKNDDMSIADHWILSRLHQTIETVHHYFGSYRFDLLAKTIYEFIWNEYCDWYLELSKPVLYGDSYSESQKQATRYTLVTVLEQILKLLHPLMPYITEEIWQRVAPLAEQQGDTIMLQAYPEVDKQFIQPDIEAEVVWLKQVVVGIRTIRSEMNIPPSKNIPVYLAKGHEQDKQRYLNNANFLINLAKLETITWLNADQEAPASATALAGQMEILIPLAGLIDKDNECARLNKAIGKIKKDLERVHNKLNNPKFMDKAPPEVVSKERTRLDEMELSIGKLAQQLAQIQAL